MNGKVNFSLWWNLQYFLVDFPNSIRSLSNQYCSNPLYTGWEGEFMEGKATDILSKFSK